MDEEIRDKLKVQAAIEKRPMAKIVNELIKQYLEQKEKENNND
jgi:predicted DNA-binding protein